MKKVLTTLLFLSVFNNVHAQVPSDCTIPQLLAKEYETDIKNNTIRRMLQQQSPDTVFVHIPQPWLDTIGGGLASIFNATSIPERDSVFNLYCVHDLTTDHIIYQSLLIQVDTTYAWTQAWQSLTAMTGNAGIDSMVVKYDLRVDEFYNWSFGNYALIATDSLWNIYALIDSLETQPGILSGEANAIIGAAGKIIYHQSGSDRYYDFYFEFNDCFDGCDNYHEWRFKVNTDCSVEYLGFLDWGFFQIEPLPPPLNCNTFTSVAEGYVQHDDYSVYPNPAETEITITGISKNKKGARAMLYDVTGRLILKTETFFNSVKINLRDVAGGMYSLVIMNDEQQASFHKVVKR